MDGSGIGIFDSGFGGLTFLKEAKSLMPDERFIYYGDNKNAPYGNKSEEQIYNLSASAFEYFEKIGVKAAVVACNTVTAECIDRLRERFKYKIFGMEPAVKVAHKELKGEKFLVMATDATLKSERIKKLFENYPELEILKTSELAGEIEKQIFDLEKIDLMRYFKGIDAGKYRGAVLGCTHYIYLKERLKKFFPDWSFFDGNKGTALNLKKYLEKEGLNGKSGEIHFAGECILRNCAVYFEYCKN